MTTLGVKIQTEYSWFSLTWSTTMFSRRNKEKDLHKLKKSSIPGEYMAIVSLFRGSNMAAVTSGENH